MVELTEWMFEQGALVVVLCVILFFMYKAYKQKDKDKDLEAALANKKIESANDKVFDLAEKVVVVATMYESNKHETEKDHDEIKEILIELKALFNARR